MLIASVPLRRNWAKRGLKLSDRSLAGASLGWGLIAGGTSGAGVLLLSMLMGVGLQGSAVIATDAAISIGMGLVKASTFALAGALGAREVAIAVLMGAVAVPGAFLARSIAKRLPLDVHTAILDSVVVIGGGTMVAVALVQ